jgi:hypothetical protein
VDRHLSRDLSPIFYSGELTVVTSRRFLGLELAASLNRILSNDYAGLLIHTFAAIGQGLNDFFM